MIDQTVRTTEQVVSSYGMGYEQREGWLRKAVEAEKGKNASFGVVPAELLPAIYLLTEMGGLGVLAGFAEDVVILQEKARAAVYCQLGEVQRDYCDRIMAEWDAYRLEHDQAMAAERGAENEWSTYDDCPF